VRERDGEEMTSTFAAMWERARRDGGRARLLARALAGLPLVAIAEWFDQLAPPGRSRQPEVVEMEALLRGVRQAARSLLRTPAFTWSTVLLLGVGVGSVTTIFTLVDHVLLRPLPYPDAERLFVVENGSHSGHDWRFFQSMPSVESWVATSETEVNLTGEGDPVRLSAMSVTEGYFTTFGARPTVGRLLVPEDYAAADVVVLSHPAWERLFGRDPGVVGRTLRIDDQPMVVVGVAEEGFVPPMTNRWGNPDVWAPQNFTDPSFDNIGSHTLSVVGRLRPSAALTDAQLDADAVAEQRARDFPDAYIDREGRRAELPLARLQDATVAPEVRQGLGLLFGAVVLLLLVACANVAHLFMARGLARGREMAVRRALGAGTGALSAQLLTESLLVAGAGAALGVGVAIVGLPAFMALAPGELPRAAEVSLDARVLGFALGVSALTALVFGMLPTLRVARRAPGEALHAGGRTGSAGRATRTMRGGLVVAEVALSLVLVAQAGLLLRSFQRLYDQPLGFRVDDVWTLPVRISARRNDADAAALLRRFDGIRAALAVVPGVRAASYGLSVPMEHTGGNRCCWRTIGGLPGIESTLRISMHPVGADYFMVFEPRVVAGSIWGRDLAELVPAPALLNEPAAVAVYGSASGAIGREIELGRIGYRVVGVVAEDRHYGPDQDHGLAAYVPMSTVPFPVNDAHMAVIADGAASDLPQRLREAVWRVEPSVPVPVVRSMESWVAGATAGTRFDSVIFGAFGAIALLLAAGGLYGTLLYTVGMQRRELGIRLALGAARREIEGRVLGQGLRLAVAGAVLGIAGAWATSTLLEGRLFGVEPGDPATLAVAAAGLLLTAALACWLPARRAAATDPLETLREE
jgi:putative ABC transport system permease protein